MDSESDERNWYTKPLCRVSSSKGHYFPLLIIRTRETQTVETDVQLSPFLEGCGQSTPHLFRALLDIHVGLVVKIPDLADLWLQSSAFEDGYRVTGSRVRGRDRGHGEREVLVLLPFSDARPQRLCPASYIKYGGHYNYLAKSIGLRNSEKSRAPTSSSLRRRLKTGSLLGLFPPLSTNKMSSLDCAFDR